MDRKKLDFYLSSALGVPLKEGKLQDIDDSHYVLTLDYTIKVQYVGREQKTLLDDMWYILIVLV